MKCTRYIVPLPLFFDPIYSQLNLPARHRFPIQKYQALADRAKDAYSTQITFNAPTSSIALERLNRIHSATYCDAFLSGEIDSKAMKRIGFEWSEQFVKRTLTAVSGTIGAAECAAEQGIAINLTGGYHHAHSEFGSGFCVFNDLALAADNLIDKALANRVLIFDTDVHQGDGTATCVQHRPDIFSCSIHCEKNFPARKQQSDWDIGLEKACDDGVFLATVEQALLRCINGFKPDFVIYDAGVDIHQDDDLGLLNITTAGIAKRDELVFSKCKQYGLPVMAVIGGGYQRDISALTDLHFQLITAAVNF